MVKIKVLVADDHPAFREGLSRLIDDEKDMKVIAKAMDGEETVRLAKELKPDVAIIDVAMPKMNGIECAKQIKEACPDTTVLMISAYDYESYALDSISAGAAGYLLKTVDLSDFLGAIRLACNEQGILFLKTRYEVLHPLSYRKPERRGSHGCLHPRELQILKLVAQGFSNKAIAHELNISERTVETHLKNTFVRLGVSSRTEAVTHVLQNAWISLDELQK